jgi:hypothetical protein
MLLVESNLLLFWRFTFIFGLEVAIWPDPPEVDDISLNAARYRVMLIK